MALPADLSVITVTGTYVGLDGSPGVGRVSFTANQMLSNQVDNTFVIVNQFTTSLDSNGHFSIQLPAGNDPDWFPQGWTYLVYEMVSNAQSARSYNVLIPYDAPGGTIDLTELSPVPPSNTPTIYVLASSVGQPNGVASLDGTGNVPADQLGNAPGVSGVQLMDQTISTMPVGTGPAPNATNLKRLTLPYPLFTTNPDLEQIWAGTGGSGSTPEKTTWRNEWGALRGTPALYYVDDALIRGVPRSGLTTQNGGYLELQNPTRTQTMHARRWRDGVLMRSDGTGPAQAMADTLVLSGSTPVPAGTPAGTVIVRI